MAGKLQQAQLPFRIEGTDEPLIARAGLILPYEMAKAVRLPEVIDRELPPPGSGRGYKPSQFVMPLILMLHGGGKRLEDLREIKGEVSLRELLGMKDLPASCTVGDWLRRMGCDGKGLSRLGNVSDHVTAEVLKRDTRTGYTLDSDAVVVEAEKEEAQWTYKKEKGYQPLLGFLFELGLALGDDFREGNVPAGAGTVEFLEHCCRRMPKGKRIDYYRSDSAAYQAGVMNWCFDHKVLFTITADQDKAVKETIGAIKEREWQPHEGDRQIAETVHTMNATKESFRLIVQRWPKLQGELFNPDPYCYHAVATNREEKPSEVVSLHNQRGQAENYIKELINGFGMEYMPCGETYANAVFFRIGVIAYNLFLALKLMGLPVWWQKHTIATVRWKLYQVAARLVHHARQILLKLAAPVDKVAVFRRVYQKCFQLSHG